MARNDGIDRTFARNRNLKEASIVNAQRHNERENDAYKNPDIVPGQTQYNVHFKKPTANKSWLLHSVRQRLGNSDMKNLGNKQKISWRL